MTVTISGPDIFLQVCKYSPFTPAKSVDSKALTVCPGDFSLTTVIFCYEVQLNRAFVFFLINVISDNQWHRKVIPYNEIQINSTNE